MLVFLLAVRDAIIALALAWVGVTIESRVTNEGCASEQCRAQPNE